MSFPAQSSPSKTENPCQRPPFTLWFYQRPEGQRAPLCVPPTTLLLPLFVGSQRVEALAITRKASSPGFFQPPGSIARALVQTCAGALSRNIPRMRTTVCADGTHFARTPVGICFAPPKEKQSLDSLPTPLRGPFEKLSHRTCRGRPPMPATTFKEALPPVRMRRVMRGTGHPHYAGGEPTRTFHQNSTRFSSFWCVNIRNLAKPKDLSWLPLVRADQVL